MSIPLRRLGVVSFVVLAAGVAAAQQLPTAPPSRPADRPVRLMVAQQLAMAAYPELRTRGLQLRVDESGNGSTVTLGFSDRDGADLLALSRPRAAQLVVEGTFDAEDTLVRAVLRGPLAKTKERREVHALASGWTEALEAGGAAFAPTRQAAFVQQLDLAVVRPIAGAVTVQGTQFQRGPAEDGLYWEVAATTAAGEPITLGFEPYAGRLVRFAKGGGQ